MKPPDLKPWSLRPLARAFVLLFGALFTFVAGVMIYTLPMMQATLVGKGLILTLALSGVGCAFALFMWTRYSGDILLYGSFWQFISAPAPQDDYPEELQAWRWGRRYMACWAIMAVSMILLVVVETLR